MRTFHTGVCEGKCRNPREQELQQDGERWLCQNCCDPRLWEEHRRPFADGEGDGCFIALVLTILAAASGAGFVLGLWAAWR